MSHKGLTRKSCDLVAPSGKRILIVNHDKCKPTTPSFIYLSKLSGYCGKECIEVKDNKIIIHDNACLQCLNKAKQCPHNVVKVVNLPTNFNKDINHCFGYNCFKLHGLPFPSQGAILGIIGKNGIGKSTIVSILSGKIKPNLGNFTDPPIYKDICQYYRGSELQNYFNLLERNKLKISVKNQLDGNCMDYFEDKTVKEILNDKEYNNENIQYIIEQLDLIHLMDRNISKLSGGEFQRLSIAITLIQKSDVYIFDELSSFLDIKQRIKAIQLIRSLLVTESNSKLLNNNDNKKPKYVIIVEHDLAVMDYISDYICCLYGEPGVYGVTTKVYSSKNGINNFLSGYIPTENILFRREEIQFNQYSFESTDNFKNNSNIILEYSVCTKILNFEKNNSKFILNIQAGKYFNSEIIVLLGENGSGKTTFMNFLIENQYNNLSFSYKQQYYATNLKKYEGTVKELFHQKINSYYQDRMFKLLVLNPLEIQQLENFQVKHLSGGQLQRIAITLCLGTAANIFLLDEPSAGLDCEQRIIISKVIRKWIVSHLNRTAIIIEHDFIMASSLADKVILFSGEPGIESTVSEPLEIIDGFNQFLKQLNITFRRDPSNNRPRINKKDSTKDQEQKQSGNYFNF